MITLSNILSITREKIMPNKEQVIKDLETARQYVSDICTGKRKLLKLLSIVKDGDCNYGCIMHKHHDWKTSVK